MHASGYLPLLHASVLNLSVVVLLANIKPITTITKITTTVVVTTTTKTKIATKTKTTTNYKYKYKYKYTHKYKYKNKLRNTKIQKCKYNMIMRSMPLVIHCCTRA